MKEPPTAVYEYECLRGQCLLVRKSYTATITFEHWPVEGEANPEGSITFTIPRFNDELDEVQRRAIVVEQFEREHDYWANGLQ